MAIPDPDGDEKTLSLLKKTYPGVRYIKNEDKEGPGGKRNTGLKHAKGKYIVFLDSDDQLKSNFLSVMSKDMKDSDASATICLSDKLFERGFSLKERILRLALSAIQELGFLFSYFFNKGDLIKSSFYLCQLSHMVFKRNSIGNTKFNYDYRKGGEDWDFCFKILCKGNIKILPRRLIVFRYSWGSSTYTPETMKAKWTSYHVLGSRLPRKVKKSLFYELFKYYINIFNK